MKTRRRRCNGIASAAPPAKSIKDLKIGFGMEYVLAAHSKPTRHLRHRRVDLYSLRVFAALRSQRAGSAHKCRPCAEVVSDRGQDRPAWQANVLKINSAMLAVFTAIRERRARFMQEGCVMPERRDHSAAFSPSGQLLVWWSRGQTPKSPGMRSKPSSQGIAHRRRPLRDTKRAEDPLQARRVCVNKNRIADFQRNADFDLSQKLEFDV